MRKYYVKVFKYFGTNDITDLQKIIKLYKII